MAILNYTTKIDSTKTISEIQQILVKHGASKIVTDYEGEIPVAVTFHLLMNGRTAAFSLPCNYSGVLKAMEKDRKISRSFISKEQALRVSWRIVKDWVEAQMAIVEAQLADIAEVFLPYAITKYGTTVYHELSSSTNQLLMLGE